MHAENKLRQDPRCHALTSTSGWPAPWHQRFLGQPRQKRRYSKRHVGDLGIGLMVPKARKHTGFVIKDPFAGSLEPAFGFLGGTWALDVSVIIWCQLFCVYTLIAWKIICKCCQSSNQISCGTHFFCGRNHGMWNLNTPAHSAHGGRRLACHFWNQTCPTLPDQVLKTLQPAWRLLEASTREGPWWCVQWVANSKNFKSFVV